MDGGADKGVGITNDLAYFDKIPYRHRWLTRGTDMLYHRQVHLIGHRHFHRSTVCRVFVMLYVDRREVFVEYAHSFPLFAIDKKRV
jgi:hypothetical protein